MNSVERKGLRQKGNVPTLRFPEYVGEWKKHTLGEMGNGLIGLTYSPAEVVGEGGTIVFRSSNIQNGEISYDDIIRVNKNIKDNIITRKGDLLICARNGSTRLIGKNALISDEDTGQTFGAFMLVYRSNENQFIHKLLNTKKYTTQVSENLGARINQITSANLSEFEFYFPQTKAERDKIAKFLNLVNERIKTQSKIIEKLQSLITALNNYLMDNHSWEKVRVGDFMDFYSTNSLSWEQLDYEFGKVKNLHYGLIHSGLPTLIDCCLCSLPNIKNGFLPKQYTLCEDGDVAFADASEDTNEVGKAVEIYHCREQSVVCGLHTIHGRDNGNATIVGFKGFAFNAKYFHDQLRRISQGSKVYSISTDNVKSCYLRIPPKSEQEKVVRLLRAYLQKIDIAKQELNAYQTQKQFLLKAMFV